MDEKFKVVDENGIESEANVITAFSYKDKEYLIYSIDKDIENTNVFVSRLVKDAEGYDTLKDIEDENELLEVRGIVNEMLDSIK